MAAENMCGRLPLGRKPDLISGEFWPHRSIGIATKYQLLGQETQQRQLFQRWLLFVLVVKGARRLESLAK